MNKKPRERIIDVAKIHFLERGYNATGVNQIIEDSKTAKATFYDAFDSKESLAHTVLRIYQADTLKWFRKIKRECDTPDKFINFLYKEIKIKTKKNQSYHRGFPIVILSMDFPEDDSKMRNYFKEDSSKWLIVLQQILKNWEKKKLILQRGNGEKIAKMIISSFQGTLIMWNLTQDETYLDSLKDQLKRIII